MCPTAKSLAISLTIMAAIIMNKQPYTCICCQVAFSKSEHQRAHYKTDWHRYNLKRQVAELPPVTALAYQEKVVAITEADAEQREAKQAQYCSVCRKTFSNRNSLQQHERSRKHKEMEAKAIVDQSRNTDSQPKVEESKLEKNETSEDDEEDENEESEPLEVTECLFCPNYENTMEDNLSHMGRAHGFFIPDLEYLVDLEGLIQYLGEKVGLGYMCLYCNESGKQFRSVEAAQHHMVDKSHCKVMFEGDAALEYAEYFDYTKSYPSGQEGEDGDQLVPSEHMLKINNDLELVLPSGTVVGHRHYKHFYKQHLPVNTKKATSVSRVMAAYRAIGWNSSCDDHMRRRRDEKWAEKMKQAKTLKTSVRANKFQPHFRPQVVF